MSKYFLFGAYLESLNTNQTTVSFSEFENIISNKLPPTARKHRAWWANAVSDSTHTWANIWLDSGWMVSNLDLVKEYVVFTRTRSNNSIRYWWVNQNQTYEYEVPGGFLWSPKVKADGGRNQFYVNMTLAKPGDLVFSFCDTYIKAVGVVTKPAKSAPKPNLGRSGVNWSAEGWLVEVEFKEVENKIRPKDHMNNLERFLPSKYSPLQANGNGLQSVYLAEISQEMANALAELIGFELKAEQEFASSELNQDEIEADALESVIKERTDIGPTKILQLVEARRGQGIFKSNLRLVETKCRVTGISDINHLRASHIKPWKDSDDQEKISGSNGLLLAPHVDHLFDRGYISFTNNGQMLVSKYLDLNILNSWSILTTQEVGKFSEKQKVFLEHHRSNVFKK
jgi:putative restriction endonuclease